MSIDLAEAFEAASDEYIEFERVDPKRHPRPDMHAFLLLTELVPGDGGDLVCAAEHDEIWLDIDCEALAEMVTQDQVVELARCGVRYDAGADSLAMFV